MERLAKVVKVTLESLKCTHTHEEGSVEIYGDLRALGFFEMSDGVFAEGSRIDLWNKPEDDDLVMGDGGTHFINSSGQLVIFGNMRRVNDQDQHPEWIGGHNQLRLGGRIVDNEGFPLTDDVLGDGYRIINYENLPSLGQPKFEGVGFLGHGKEVVASFRIDLVSEQYFPLP